MLIPLIYLISGWRWALFTSDVPLLGKADERERNRERTVRTEEYQKRRKEKKERTREEENRRGASGSSGGMDGVRCDCAS